MAKSNKAWLKRHVTDPYVKQAKAQGYRSRAAFKLLEIDNKEKLLSPGMLVVDLGAAPGGWSQVASERVSPGGRVIAIDLLQIAPIPGVTALKADFRDPKLIDTLKGAKADVVLSDISPNLSGIPNVDQARAAEMTQAAIDFCLSHLKSEGTFLVKLFHGEAFDEVVSRLKQVFQKVSVKKPAASRGESAETYVLARLLRPVKTA